MLLGKLKLWAIAAGGVLLAVLAAFGIGRREGRKATETKHLRRRVEAAREAREVEDEVNKLDDDAVHDALGEWMRKGD